MPQSLLIRIGMAFAMLTMLWSQVAWAEDCKGISELGQCLDLKTLQWCADGVVKTAPCPEDEICVKSDADDGHFTCMNKEYTACAEIPDEGKCTSGNSAVWCVDGRVEIKECQADEVCTLIPEGWVDCMPEEHLQTPPEDVDTDLNPSGEDAPDRGDSASESDAGPEEILDEDGANPTPNVKQGDNYEPTPTPGCGTGSHPDPWTTGLLLAIGFIFTQRRRA